MLKALYECELVVLSLVLLLWDIWRTCITWIIQIILQKKRKTQIGENKKKFKAEVERLKQNILQIFDLYSLYKLASGLN